MAMAVIDVIGALAGVVGDVVRVGMMIPGLLPDQDEDHTIVRVAAGLSSNEGDTTSGKQPSIGLYDIVGRTIGSTHGHGTIKDGDFNDISVPFADGVGKKPTEYISVANGGDDALCIAYLALTQPDGTKKAWYGDVGKACGADWYHSLLKTGDDDYQPSCIWIDKNRSNGLRFQGLGLHINDFAATDERAAQYNNNRDLMCNAAPRFRMYEDMTRDDYIPFFNPPLEYVEKNLTDMDPAAVMNKATWVLPQEGPNIKKSVVDADPVATNKMLLHRRQNSPAHGAIASSNGTFVSNTRPVGGKSSSTASSKAVVIISTSPNHSAKELCQSPASWGHDFVSDNESLFCDMSTKKLWPVCNDAGQAGVTSGCFDKAQSVMRPLKGGLRGRNVRTGAGDVVPVKKYGKTLHWD